MVYEGKSEKQGGIKSTQKCVTVVENGTWRYEVCKSSNCCRKRDVEVSKVGKSGERASKTGLGGIKSRQKCITVVEQKTRAPHGNLTET